MDIVGGEKVAMLLYIFFAESLDILLIENRNVMEFNISSNII